MVETTKQASVQQAEQFFEELERLVRRYAPQTFGVTISSLLHRVMRDANQWTYYPPHMLVNAVEANCAYFRGHRDNPVTPDRINEILNHYKAYYDPYLRHVLENRKSLDLLFLAMSRQQFDLQRSPTLSDFARALLLYVTNNPLPRSSVLFENHTGFTFHEWVYMCFAVHAYVMTHPDSPLISPDNFLSSTITSIPMAAVKPFFQRASLSPKAFGQEYRSLRQDYEPYLHTFLKSVFLKHPLIAYDDDNYLVVHPYLILHHADEGLYQNCLSIASKTFYGEFSRSFEKYVGSILADFFPQPSIFPESRIQSLSPGRSCDFLVNHPDCVLLVECKAIRFSSDLFTENAVRQDNSTGKVAKAFGQIYETAKRIANGELGNQLGYEGKPLVGIVVTYGELYFVNSPFYFETFISKRMDDALLEDWPGELAYSPQVMKIDSLENFLVVTRETGHSPLDLIQTKLSLPYEQTGDWPQYMKANLDKAKDRGIPILQAATDKFFRGALGDRWPRGDG